MRFLLSLLCCALAAGEPPPQALTAQPYAGEASTDRQRLDLWVPAGAERAPVLCFVHGGAWVKGDRRLSANGLPAWAAAQGWATAALGYRLSPQVQHPAHVQDLAAALAWLRANAAAQRIDPDRIVLIGHSAGAHLVALLVADPRHLEAAAVPRAAIRAVIPVDCASYAIPDPPADPERLKKEMHTAPFGATVESRRDASPTHQVRAGIAMPPYLVVTQTDKPVFHTQAQGLHQALLGAQYASTLLEIPDIDHIGIFTRIGQAKHPATAPIAALLKQVRAAP